MSEVVVINKKLALERTVFTLLFCCVCNLEFGVLGRDKELRDVCMSYGGQEIVLTEGVVCTWFGLY